MNWPVYLLTVLPIYNFSNLVCCFVCVSVVIGMAVPLRMDSFVTPDVFACSSTCWFIDVDFVTVMPMNCSMRQTSYTCCPFSSACHSFLSIPLTSVQLYVSSHVPDPLTSSLRNRWRSHLRRWHTSLSIPWASTAAQRAMATKAKYTSKSMMLCFKRPTVLAWFRPPKYFRSIFISLQYYVWVCGIFAGFLRPNFVRPISKQREWLRTMMLKSALVDGHLHTRCVWFVYSLGATWFPAKR